MKIKFTHLYEYLYIQDDPLLPGEPFLVRSYIPSYYV